MSIATYLKGITGELLNRAGHRLFLPRTQYHGFHNIVIPSGKGTTELDHVIVSTLGIFVVETKFWSGTIYGSEWDKRWTLFTRRSKHSVYNPLRQNYGHVTALAELLAIPVERVGSVVAIRGAKFKTEVPKGVILGGYARHVRKAQAQQLDESEVQRILAVLRSDRVGRGWIARLRHRWFTKARHADAETDSPREVLDTPVASDDLARSPSSPVTTEGDARPDAHWTPSPPRQPHVDPPTRSGWLVERLRRFCRGRQPGGRARGPQEELTPQQEARDPQVAPLADGRMAFCIGCRTSMAFDPARPMCPSCFRSSRRGKDLAPLVRRSCHRCGKQHLGSLRKPICHTCWTQLPKNMQQEILDSLR